MKGVSITHLKQIHHPKGDIYHALKSSENTFCGFGEAYFSSIKTGEVKGWKQHKRMTMNLIVPVGEIEFFIHDEKQAKTKTFLIGLENFCRLTISPGLWVAFKGGASSLNLLLNIASIEHDPAEAVNVPLNTFPLKGL